MQKFGIIQDKKLVLNSVPLTGYKPVVFAAIPTFNQETQCVFQDVPIDNKDHISVGVIVRVAVPGTGKNVTTPII